MDVSLRRAFWSVAVTWFALGVFGLVAFSWLYFSHGQYSGPVVEAIARAALAMYWPTGDLFSRAHASLAGAYPSLSVPQWFGVMSLAVSVTVLAANSLLWAALLTLALAVVQRVRRSVRPHRPPPPPPASDSAPSR